MAVKPLKLYKTGDGKVFTDKFEAESADRFERFWFEYEQLTGEYYQIWHLNKTTECKDLMDQKRFDAALTELVKLYKRYYKNAPKIVDPDSLITESEPVHPKLSLYDRVAGSIYLLLTGKK